MSTKKYLINTLESCEKHEFDEIVKTYLKQIYGFKRVVFTDGVNDTGIDIKIFDLDKVKNQYQLTVQKSSSSKEKRAFEEKLFEDVEKAKTNHLSFGYSNTLHFFHSYPLTNKNIRELANRALVDFGINLNIIDANVIAEEAEEYLQLMNAIVATNNIKDILDTEKVFPASEENLVFYEKLILRLQSEKKIKKTDDKSAFFLQDSEAKKISNLIAQNEVEEIAFLNDLKVILNDFNQSEYIEEYVIELKKIYISNFHADIEEILSTETKELGEISREFWTFLRLKGIEDGNTKVLAQKLFKLCKENNFIQKFCAAKVFSETTNIRNIERYIHNRKRVFVDTQIILHSLCYFYNPKSTYSDYFFVTTKSLLEFTRKNKIKLHVPSNYLWEAQNHLREALNLIPFTNLPNFEKLGKSRNALYNFFLYERSQLNDVNFTYLSFFEKFGFKVYDKYTVHNDLIGSYISNLGLEVVTVENQFYDIEDTKKIITNVLNTDNKFKSKFGLNNDAIILEYLADKDTDIHPLQPMLLSWDKVLFKSQKKFFEKNPTAPRWFLLTPGRFIDQYSLLQLSIDADIVTNEILAFLSNDLIHRTHSLLDSITHILNPNDEVGLEYTNILGQIRDNEIHRLKENSAVLPDDIEGEAVIDDVMYNLTSHYRENKNMFDAFKDIFSNKDLIQDVTSLIEKTIEEIYNSKKFSNNILFEFDKLIEKEISKKTPPSP